MKPEKYVVSLSGGKDSTAMLLRLLEEKRPVDLILFCDTGLEFPQMYEHLARLEAYIGRPITRLKAEHDFEYYFLHYTPKRKNPVLAQYSGMSWAGPRNRWCTGILKTRVVDAYLKELRKSYTVIEYVGIAAVLSRSLSNITDITKFMDECKAMGIQVLGPDVNESILKFSVDKNKNIRFGLGAVKGVGESAVQNIIEERKKNGPYKSIFDFVERVNLTACNKKNIESMALAGAFDNFGIQREQFFTDSGKGELFLDTLVRYGNKYQMDKSTAVNSLFGGDALIAIAKPEIPQCERWSDLERLNKEKELVGIYLSAHPLDEYRIILKYVCNTGMVELNERETLQGREVLLGGIVTGFREGMTKNGKPYGILKIEDFTGSGEIPLFGQDYIEYSKYGKIGMYLLITARVEPSRWDPNKLDFKIGTVNLLQDEKDKLIEKISITVPIHDLDEPTINELSVLIKNNPGHSLLYFKVVDGEHNISLNLFSQNIRLNVTRELVDFLQENENIDFKING